MATKKLNILGIVIGCTFDDISVNPMAHINVFPEREGQSEFVIVFREDDIATMHIEDEMVASVTLRVNVMGSPGNFPTFGDALTDPKYYEISQGWYLTKKQYSLLVEVIAKKCKRYNIKPDGEFSVRHEDENAIPCISFDSDYSKNLLSPNLKKSVFIADVKEKLKSI